MNWKFILFNKNLISTILFLSFITFSTKWYLKKTEENLKRKNQEITKIVVKKAAKGFMEKEDDSKIVYGNRKFDVKYTTTDKDLKKHVKRLLRRYRSDYASVVIIDNNSGKILLADGYNGREKEVDKKIPFSTTNPAASLFKIVAVSDLLENTNISPDSVFTFRGKGTTLYKYQFKDKKTRWLRRQSLSRAFALSNNVVIGKASMENSTPERIEKVATKFGFKKKIMKDVDVGPSDLLNVQSDYNMAELSSGFNKKTLISPVHAALLSSVVANDGVLKTPYLIESVKSEDGGIHWKPGQDNWRVISPETAEDMKSLMGLTVKRGTARSSFRRFMRKYSNKFIVGGKTGSITGGVPHGKRDWFTAFLMPRGEGDKGISISVMNVNIDKWKIKSSKLASMIFEYMIRKNYFPFGNNELGIK